MDLLGELTLTIKCDGHRTNGLLTASDGTDENDDILLMDGDTIKKNDKEMRDQLLQTSQTTVKTEQPKPNP